jgi:hypothetical protein
MAAGASFDKNSEGMEIIELMNASRCDAVKKQTRKYAAASSPMNAPIRGNRNMDSADVTTKSSVLLKDITVRKDSKSLKVFIAFVFDI